MLKGDIKIRSDYEPSPSGITFHSSPAKFKVLVGGLGSGKSRMGVEEVMQLAAENDGIEMFVMRKTMPSLRDSTLNEFLKYMPEELGTYNKKTETFNVINDSKIMFRGLDEFTKIKSTNVAVIVMDEADEFTFDDFQTLKNRIRQMRRDGGAYPLHMILILNPVDEDHWIYQQFVNNKAEYEKAGGVLELHLSTYENLKNLPPGYIEQATAGMTEQEINRYVDGNWGTVVKGKPVYTDVFRSDLHIKAWKFSDLFTLCRGWDFGFNHPACSFVLKDHLNRKNIHFEMMGDRTSLEIFAKQVIVQTENRYGKDVRVMDFCDPRGFDKSDKSSDGTKPLDGTSVGILNDAGIYPTGERGIRAYVEPGIQIIRKQLSTLIGTEPELTVSPDAPILKAGFGGRYVRDDNGNPKKDGFYEHLMDSLRYIAYNDRANDAVKQIMQNQANKRANRTYNKYTGY